MEIYQNTAKAGVLNVKFNINLYIRMVISSCYL
jgi:hypothetical protein